jgi:hypothetical protein
MGSFVGLKEYLAFKENHWSQFEYKKEFHKCRQDIQLIPLIEPILYHFSIASTVCQWLRQPILINQLFN